MSRPTHLTLSMIQELVRQQGNICLNDSYHGFTSKLKIQCIEGHIFECQAKRFLNNALTPNWCPICLAERKSEQSTDYRVNPETGEVTLLKLKRKNTTVETKTKPKHSTNSLHSFQPKTSLEEIQKIANERGGVCLNASYGEGYGNVNSYLDFECSKKHHWKVICKYFLRGSWCPHCETEERKLKLYSKILKYAKTINNEVLTSGSEFVSGSFLKIKCKKNHTRTLNSLDTIKQFLNKKTDCRECINTSKKLSIDVYKQVAKQRGGECLSVECRNAFDKLTWKCAKGHTWEAMAQSVKNRFTWCPICAGSRKF